MRIVECDEPVDRHLRVTLCCIVLHQLLHDPFTLGESLSIPLLLEPDDLHNSVNRAFQFREGSSERFDLQQDELLQRGLNPHGFEHPKSPAKDQPSQIALLRIGGHDTIREHEGQAFRVIGECVDRLNWLQERAERFRRDRQPLRDLRTLQRAG